MQSLSLVHRTNALPVSFELCVKLLQHKFMKFMNHIIIYFLAKAAKSKTYAMINH